jgi:hypothetical protein
MEKQNYETPNLERLAGDYLYKKPMQQVLLFTNKSKYFNRQKHLQERVSLHQQHI